jgi:hypothetical protein
MGAPKTRIKYMDKVMLGLIVSICFLCQFSYTECSTFINHPVIDAVWS